MKTKIYFVDAFTDTPFTGNPACVAIIPEPRDDSWMQKLAFEVNFSETAFLHQRDDGFDLRWFTPRIEVDLCGHATLAAAHLIWECGFQPPEQEISFHTKSGILTAKKNEDRIEMGFPALYPRPEEFNPEFLDIFKISPTYAGMFDGKLMFEVEKEEDVLALDPDFSRLKKHDGRAVLVTAKVENKDYDFVSRYFAPWVGVNEDPVTGTSHCCLAVYWSRQLDKPELRAYQASPRGGYLTTRVEGDRVILGGQAVTTMAGEILV